MSEHLPDVQLSAEQAARARALLHAEMVEVPGAQLRAARLIVHLQDQLHKNDRWNVETTADGFRVCRGYHERSAGCEWEYFVRRTTETTGEGAK